MYICIFTYIHTYILQIAVNASALEKPGTWVRLPASVRFFIIPLRPFLYAALAKRWKVQFRKGLRKFNNVDSETTYFNENCCIM